MKPAADVPLAKGRSTDSKNALPFMRPSQTTTPPGSARALDELPPLTEGTPSVVIATGVGDGSTPSSEDAALAVYSGDGTNPARRGRGMLLAAGAIIVASVIVAGGFLGASWRPSGDSAPKDQAAAPPPTSTSGVSAPIPQPLGAATAPVDHATTAPGTPRPDTGSPGSGGERALAVAATSEPLEEHSADPKLARARVAEAGTLLAGCRAAFHEGRMKDAEAACVAARDANPDSAEAYGLLAHALFNRNSRRREALVAAEKAVKLNPKWADAYVIIGGVHQDAGNTAEAKRAYQRYLELDPRGQYAPDLRAIVGKLEPAKM
jgi:hypothetical protein